MLKIHIIKKLLNFFLILYKKIIMLNEIYKVFKKISLENIVDFDFVAEYIFYFIQLNSLK